MLVVRRSPWRNLISALAFLTLAIALGAVVFGQKLQENLRALLEEENLRVARLAALTLAREGSSVGNVKQFSDLVDARITVILPDGKVSADSETGPDSMDNHADRAEIRAAQAGGWGQSIRRSATLGWEMIYTAVKMEGEAGKPAGFVRVARSLRRIDQVTVAFRQTIWIAAVVVVLMSMLACYVFIELRISREERVVKVPSPR